MHTFPRSVKQKHGLISSPTQVAASSSQDNATSALVPLDDYSTAMSYGSSRTVRPRPQRKAYLVTVDRHNPMRRVNRELGNRSDQDQKPIEPKKRDEVRELVLSCDPSMPASFNHALENDDGLFMLNRNGVLLMIERMRQSNVPMETQTYNLLLEKVVDLKDTLAFQIYADLKDESQKEDSSVKPDLHTFHLLMRACDRHSNYKKAFQIYSQMKEIFSKYPDLAMYNTLIGFCAPLRDESMASTLIEEMRDRGVEPDVHTYNCLMGVFVDAPYELILQTFQDMVKRKVKPNRRTYNTLMRACAKIGEYDQAFMFFEELKREGLIPDVVTYNILLVLCRDRLDYVFGTGKHASLRRTKEQISLGMKAVAELSMSLVAELEDVSILPNTYTYNALLSVLGRCHDLRVFDVFDQMKGDTRAAQKALENDVVAESAQWVAESGRNVADETGSQPSQQSTGRRKSVGGGTSSRRQSTGRRRSTAVDQLPTIEIDEPGEARIGGYGVRPNLETFTTMIDASHRLQLPDRAYALLDEMKAAGIVPDKTIFIQLLDVCTIKSEKAKAYHIIDEARAQGIIIDTEVYNALMDVLAACSDPQVFEVFSHLKNAHDGMSVRPNLDSYNILLKACNRLKRTDQARAVYHEMCEPDAIVGPDASTYALMMDSCAIDRNTELATDLILQMKRRGVPPTITTYCRLMNVFVQSDDPGVVEIFNDILRHGPVPNLEAYTILLSYYLQTNNNAIVQLFEDMKSAGVEPDLNAFNIMLDFCALSTNSQARSFKYFEQIKERGLNPDIETYNALIKVFAPVHTQRPEDSTVFRIFEEMAECRIPADSVTFSILMKHENGRRYLGAAQDSRKIYVDNHRLLK